MPFFSAGKTARTNPPAGLFAPVRVSVSPGLRQPKPRLPPAHMLRSQGTAFGNPVKS
ncbi:hypothetical protein B4096_3577 [Heyndrickxia coagulans]|nr:hypothetical protein B4096_3577 [Heyndrickxia coagulans]